MARLAPGGIERRYRKITTGGDPSGGRKLVGTTWTTGVKENAARFYAKPPGWPATRSCALKAVHRFPII